MNNIMLAVDYKPNVKANSYKSFISCQQATVSNCSHVTCQSDFKIIHA